MGSARYSLNEIVLPDLPHSRPAPGLNARRTPASLVSPSTKQTLIKRALLFGSGAKFCRSKHRPLPITPRSPTSQSHRSPLVSPRQSVLYRSGPGLRPSGHSERRVGSVFLETRPREKLWKGKGKVMAS